MGRNDGRSFRSARSAKEKEDAIEKAVPCSTRYKNKWTVAVLKEWQYYRAQKGQSSDGQLSGRTSKSLLNTVYYYNGKLFGLRRREHHNITVNNFKVGSNYIKFEENVSKTFHGGLCDIKYVPRKVRHVCHKDSEKHERCLVELYKEYIDFIKIENCKVDAFYFWPLTKGFGFVKSLLV